MEETILIDLMVQLAGLEAERAKYRAALEQDQSAAEFLVGLQQEYEADAGAAQASLAEVKTKQRLAETEVEVVEAALARKRDLLGQSTDAKETLALQREITNLEGRLDALLAAACQLLEKVAMVNSSVGVVDAECVAQERRTVVRMTEIEAQQARFARALPEVEHEIRRLHATAPPQVARHLTRLWDKELVAVVFEFDGACSGCGSQMRPQQALTVQHGKELVRCPSCARFVVHKPWH